MAEEQKSFQELMDEYNRAKAESQNPAPNAPMSSPNDTMSTEPVPPESVQQSPVSLLSNIRAEQSPQQGYSDESTAMAKIAAGTGEDHAPEMSAKNPNTPEQDAQESVDSMMPEEDHAPMMSVKNPSPEEQIETPAERSNKAQAQQFLQSRGQQAQQQLPEKDLQQQLLDAQLEQKKQLAAAMIQRGGAQMLGGATRTAPDYKNADILEKQAGIPVEQLQQKIAIGDIQTKLNDAQEMRNPNSEISKSLRDFTKRMGFNLGDNTSGAHIMQVEPFIAKAYAADQAKQRAIEVANINANSRYNVADLKNTQGTSKAENKDQLQSFNKTQTLLESGRGDQAVRQAKLDKYLASKANIIFDEAKGKPSDQQLMFIKSELGKLAQGGVPNTAELKGLDPNLFMQKINTFVSKIDGKPTEQPIQEFMGQYKKYTDQLSNNADKTITEQRKRILEPAKKHLHPDDYKNLADQYYPKSPDLGTDRQPESISTGMVRIQDSKGGVHMLPAENLDKAKQRDPGLKVLQ